MPATVPHFKRLSLPEFQPPAFDDYKIGDTFIFPTEEEIIEAQGVHLTDKRINKNDNKLTLEGHDPLHQDERGAWVTETGQLWLPNEDLATRVCVIAHMGTAGHLVVETTQKEITQRFWWVNMNQFIASFVHNCLH